MTEPLTGLDDLLGDDLLGDAIEAAANALSGTPPFDARWTQAKTVIDAAYPIIAAAVRAQVLAEVLPEVWRLFNEYDESAGNFAARMTFRNAVAALAKVPT